MKNLRKYTLCLVLAIVTLLALTGCNGEGSQPESTIDPKIGVEQLSIVVTAENISELDTYPDLKEVDLTGSTCYEAIAAYIRSHPGMTVHYDVALGNASIDHEATELVLEAGSFTCEELLEKLAYLPNVNYITLPATDLTTEQLEAIRAFSATTPITVEYTVDVLGTAYAPDETALDLSALEPAQLPEILETLKLFPYLSNAELMRADGTSALSMADVKTLQDAFPGALFHYSFDLFGQTLSTTDETVAYDEVPIGNEGEEAIRQALDILTNCTYFKLDDCGLDNEVMAGIRDDYPDVKVVWRIHIDHFSMLTDEETLRLTHRLNDNNVADLKYCTDAKYVDFGHNETLSDFSFVAYMPQLEIVILSGSSVTDLTPFESCPNLEWMELCFCGFLSDISPMAGKENLKYLNISYTQVSDISMLDDVPLERFNCMKNNVSYEDSLTFKEKHPDCISVFTGVQPYGYGWRYNDNGYTFFEFYENMRVIFRYDDLNYYGNHKEY